MARNAFNCPSSIALFLFSLFVVFPSFFYFLYYFNMFSISFHPFPLPSFNFLHFPLFSLTIHYFLTLTFHHFFYLSLFLRVSLCFLNFFTLPFAVLSFPLLYQLWSIFFPSALPGSPLRLTTSLNDHRFRALFIVLFHFSWWISSNFSYFSFTLFIVFHHFSRCPFFYCFPVVLFHFSWYFYCFPFT